MRIPQGIIEDIKFRNPIEDVISSYLTLSRAGTNMKGLCPFHSEKTPSFTVFPESQSFYCFGCGTGGDVITFIMKSENLDYPDAIEFLAKRAGITLPDDDSDKFFNKGLSRTRLIEMNTCAARFFRDMLFDEEAGKSAREYIAKRQLSPAIVRRFGLGYAPAGFNALRDHMYSKGYTKEELVEGSFCSVSEKNGSVYDKFRDRLMFPIFDVAGNITGFTGRTLSDAMPKYLNTSDTAAFKKSKVLYGLNYAKNSESEYLILCEGNIDVISLHDAGFENAIATQGTAINGEHARIIKKYTSKVIVSYDGDSAGTKATGKAVKALEDVGIELKILQIPNGLDPDDYIKQFGSQAFRELMEGSRSKHDWEIEKTLSKYSLENSDDKVKAARDLSAYAASIYSKVEQDIFIGKAAKALSVDKKSIEYDVSSIIRRNKKAENSARHDNIVRSSSGISDRVNRDFAKFPKAARLEEMVLGMMLLCGEFIVKAKRENILAEDDFATEYGKKIFAAMTAQESFDLSMLNEVMTPDEISRAVKLMEERRKLKNTDDIFRDTALSMKKECEKAKKEKSRGDVLDIIRRRREEKEER